MTADTTTDDDHPFAAHDGGELIDRLRRRMVRRMGLVSAAPDPDGFTLDAAPADIPVGGITVGTGTTAGGHGRVAVFLRHRADGLAARALLDAEAAEALAAELVECAGLIRDVDGDGKDR